MEVPDWWIAVSTLCFVVVSLVLLWGYRALSRTAARASRLVNLLVDSGLPARLTALTEQVNAMGDRVDELAHRVEHESRLARPHVESLLERVDSLVERVESGGERMSHVIGDTAEGFGRLRHNPIARSVLLGAGSLAAARLVREAVRRYAQGEQGDERAASDKEQPLIHDLPAGRTLMELPQER
mgnify:CR=1 FL=1